MPLSIVARRRWSICIVCIYFKKFSEFYKRPGKLLFFILASECAYCNVLLLIFFLVQTFSDCLVVLSHLLMSSKDEPADPLCHAGVVNSSAVNVKTLAWMRDSGTHCNLRWVLGHSDNHREGRSLAKARNQVIKRKKRAVNAAGCGICFLMPDDLCYKVVHNTKIVWVRLIRLCSSRIYSPCRNIPGSNSKGTSAILIEGYHHFPLSLQN